jgi:hypothetical protein
MEARCPDAWLINFTNPSASYRGGAQAFAHPLRGALQRALQHAHGRGASAGRSRRTRIGPDDGPQPPELLTEILLDGEPVLQK